MNQATTLILTRDDIARTLPLADCIAAVESAFARMANSRMAVPAVAHIGMPDGGFHVKSAAYVDAPHYVAVKVNGNFPGNPANNGLPTIQGAILLSDGANGALLAIMDSAEITALRTGAATAVAAKHLAPPDAHSATVIGCGVQGRVQLLSLLEVLPLETIYAFDVDRDCALRYARDLGNATGCHILPVAQFSEGTQQSQVIVTCTSSRSAFLGAEHVAPGTFIAAVGADNHDKQELDPRLLSSATVVVDVLEQAANGGELHHAIAAGVMGRDDVFAELAAVVSGTKRPHANREVIVVFDSTGCAIQDVAAAGLAYERARALGIGLPVALTAP